MGPRFQKRGNTTTYQVVIPTGSLQWGRAFRSAETGKCQAAARPAKEASMGPRFQKRGNQFAKCAFFQGLTLQWGRAFRSAETLRGSALSAVRGRRFNGAALSEARKLWVQGDDDCNSGWLQWGRAFRSAETSKDSSPPNTTAGFNGAALSEARKPGCNPRGDRGKRASMGPRFQKRGNGRLAIWGVPHFRKISAPENGQRYALLFRRRKMPRSIRAIQPAP